MAPEAFANTVGAAVFTGIVGMESNIYNSPMTSSAKNLTLAVFGSEDMVLTESKGPVFCATDMAEEAFDMVEAAFDIADAAAHELTSDTAES